MKADEQITRIREKLHELVRRYDQLQKENARLRQEIAPAKQRETEQLERIEALEQQVLVLKTASGTLDEADRKTLDKKLQGYLKEIDRCIAMLSE